MLVDAEGIVRLANFVHPLNALFPRLVTVVGMVKLAKFVQP
jgi:hypothetical protein